MDGARWITATAVSIALLPSLVMAGSQSKASIAGGRFAPLFGLDKDQVDLPVSGFSMDRVPVTNREFKAFVAKKPEWSHQRVASLFADSSYLKHWRTKMKFNWNAPVTYVSWYAASAYCEWKGGRLPSVLEWEYVGAASETKANALKEPAFAEKIRDWYARPFELAKLPNAGSGRPNYYGVRDMHGLVWEWTEDFNSTFVSGDNRQDGDKDSAFFCGNGATGSGNREDYAAFMRYAMRSSLKAEYTTANLGFRCAYDSIESGDKK